MKSIQENEEIIEPIIKQEKKESNEHISKAKIDENAESILKSGIENEKIIKKEEKNSKIIRNEEENSILKAQKKKTLRDGILTLIANELHLIGFMCLMVIHNLTTYLMSYLRHYQEEKTITLQYTYFIGPVMSITMGLFTPCVGMIENKIGLKLAIVLGGILCLWSSVILYLSKNYYFDLFAFFINSCGSSMNALLSRNLMGYFFHIRGKLHGALSVISSLVSSGYNVIGEKWIVNPKSEEAIVDKSYYTFDVSKNLLIFLKISWVCISVSTILTVIFVVPFDKKKHIRLFAPKGFKGFDKEKKKKFEKKKEIKKEDIQEDDKIGPLIPEEEKNKIENNIENEKNEKEIKDEDKKVGEKEKVNEEITKIDNEIKNEEEEKIKDKKDVQLKVKNKSDFSKTCSVPAYTVSSKDKLLLKAAIIESPENTEIEVQNRNNFKKKRSLSISYKDISQKKLPLINVIPEIEVVAVAPQEKSIRKKFNIKLIKEALKSRRVLFLFLMGLFSAPLSNFLLSTWRPIGIRKGIPTLYLQNIGTYRPFITCGSTLIFSSLSDYIPFRYLYCAFSILATFIGVTFCFTFQSPGWFTFIILLNSVVFSGKMSITSPHYMKVFGLKYYIEIGGVIGLSRVFMSPLCTVFIFLFETYIAAPEDGQTTKEVSDMPYIILFITTGLLNIIAAVLSLFETEEEFRP